MSQAAKPLDIKTLPIPRLQGVVTPARFASEVFRHSQLVVETEAARLNNLAAQFGPDKQHAALLIGHDAFLLVTWLRVFHGSRMQFLARPTANGLSGLNESWLRMLSARRDFDRSLRVSEISNLLPTLYEDVHFSFADQTENCWMRLFRDLVARHQSDIEGFTNQRGHGYLPTIPENGVIFGPEFEFFPPEAVALIDERLNQIPDLNFASRAAAAIESGQVSRLDEPDPQQQQVEFWRSWRRWVVTLREKVNNWNTISGKKMKWDAVSLIVNECTTAWGQVHHRWHDARPTKPTPEDFWALDDGEGTLPTELSNAVRNAVPKIEQVLRSFNLRRKDDCDVTTLQRVSKDTSDAIELVANLLEPFERAGATVKPAKISLDAKPPNITNRRWEKEAFHRDHAWLSWRDDGMKPPEIHKKWKSLTVAKRQELAKSKALKCTRTDISLQAVWMALAKAASERDEWQQLGWGQDRLR